MNPDFGGHGIAHELHMPPLVHHQVTRKSSRQEMLPGMAFTIEPILHLMKDVDYLQFKDGWTYQAPTNHSCQWEHIILITEGGHEILTLREGEELPLSLQQSQ